MTIPTLKPWILDKDEEWLEEEEIKDDENEDIYGDDNNISDDENISAFEPEEEESDY